MEFAEYIRRELIGFNNSKHLARDYRHHDELIRAKYWLEMCGININEEENDSREQTVNRDIQRRNVK